MSIGPISGFGTGSPSNIRLRQTQAANPYQNISARQKTSSSPMSLGNAGSSSSMSEQMALLMSTMMMMLMMLMPLLSKLGLGNQKEDKKEDPISASPIGDKKDKETNGASGPSGGAKGSGASGPSGGSGASGPSGASGNPGASGPSGAPGASGPAGSGPSGASGPPVNPSPAKLEGTGNPENPTPTTIDMKQDIHGGGPSKTTVTNRSDKPMKIAFAKNLQPGEKDPGPTIVTIEPGKTLEASLPANWAGRIWKYSGRVGDPATLAELCFENGKTWYDASVIDGYNGPMTMGPSSGKGRFAGKREDITGKGTPEMITKDAEGNTVLKTTRPNSAGTSDDAAAVAFYEQYIGGDNAYIIPSGDQKAMRFADEDKMAINFY